MNKKYIFYLLPIFILFYLVCPKYRFHYDGYILRENKITDRIDFYERESRKWLNIAANQQPKSTIQEKWKQVENNEVYINASLEKKRLMEKAFFDRFVREI